MVSMRLSGNEIRIFKEGLSSGERRNWQRSSLRSWTLRYFSARLAARTAMNSAAVPSLERSTEP
jgi:hypothetical protein